jgi:glucose/arabinose dehydrogenase
MKCHLSVRRRRLVIVVLGALAVLVTGCASGSGATPGSGDLVAIGAGLQGPSGLRATVYTRAPAHVSAFALDGQGRLWLSTAAATDAGADGVYVVPRAGAVPTEVIAGLPTPLGLLWIGRQLYVSAKDQVVAYGGFDGTSFTTHRTVVTFVDGVGELNGLALGPDGRIRLGISSPCDHCQTTSPYSASVVSFRPDGSGLRVEVSHIRAAVGLAYYPGTSDLLGTLDQRDDLGADTPGDQLVDLAQGQDYRFPHCYGQGGSACSGVPDAVATLDPHGGVDGVAVVTGQLGDSVGTAAVVAEYAVGKVQIVPLVKNPSGSGYSGAPAVFLQGLKNPVPVLLGSRRQLFVGDWTTGIIYRVTSRA